ncbi:aminoacyltransferase [Staphylococcus sp. ACRSN]|uniref:aminoacyltransferase n=1 Tax=Staphylococcus sp. ACRSN TaxID=2918214 RepID=UPI001EF16810|nr:aminoacyltransferase [Staphylococcus sp. ACRSN]MCG7338922.1 aminoacyltransferase [Staphylococcus sp. ACRSN]
MNFTKLSEEEYDNFINDHFVHYTQSVEQYQYRHQKKNDVHLVGVKDNNTVLAACLLTEAKALKFFKYFYSHKGPVLDYNNQEIVECFFKGLTKYLKQQNTLFVMVDPYILESKRNAEGEILQSFDNKHLIQQLDKLGYKHQGYSVGYSDKSQIRWMSVLDLEDKTAEQLLKSMDYQTRRNIKKTFEMGVDVRTLDYSETDTFYELFKMAEEKHGFKFKQDPNTYFQETQKMYPKSAMLKMAYIDLDKYAEKLANKNSELSLQVTELENKLIDSPNSKKNKTKLAQLKQQKDSNLKKLDETKALIQSEGNVLNLAAALYICTKDEVYYLSSGSNPKYNQFMGAYRLQWEMIEYAKKHNIPRYNFYGITGDFNENAEDFGVQQFKKGFDAHVEEFIGDFVKPIRPFYYKVYQLLNK